MHNVDFSTVSGKALLLRGANGTGKTSLLMALAGYLHISDGTINWREDGGSANDDEYSPIQNMHFIGHQHSIKTTLSLGDNLGFWCQLNGGDSNKVQPALEAAGLGHATSLDAALLSAGQSKRLSLARLLVADRPVWLLDEPTSSLDAAGDKWVSSLIDNHLDRGGMVIAATHLNLVLRNSKRVSTMTLKSGVSE